MSEFEDRHGKLLHGSARRRAVRMDGMSRRELRRRDRFERREEERTARMVGPMRRAWRNMNGIPDEK